MWGFAGLSAGSSPVPNHPRYHRLNGSPHEGLGGCAVEARLPSQIPTLCPPLDFHQRNGQGLVTDFESDQLSIPEEERLGEARGEGDPKHLPGLRGYQPPLCDYILPYLRSYVNPFLKNFFGRPVGYAYQRA